MKIFASAMLVGVFFVIVSGFSFRSPAKGNSGHYENGKAVYETTCFACHGKDGKGAIPGVPDFTKNNGPLNQPDDVLFDHVKNGFQSPGSMMPMPPLGGNPDLTDQDIRDAIFFLRQEFQKK